MENIHKIEPEYVSFDIAKILKEKNILIFPHTIKNKTDNVLGYDYDMDDENDTLKISEFQWEDNRCSHLYLMPHIWEVIELLRTNYGIHICSDFGLGWESFTVPVGYEGNASTRELHYNHTNNESPKEAFLKAIEYTLNKLI